MPRNGSGTFTLVSGNPVVSGTTIESNWANTTLSDIATTLTDSLSRSGQGGMTAALRVADGSQGAPGVGFANETGSGFYRAGTGEVWAVVQGAQTLNLDANGVYVPADKSTTVDGAFVFNEAGADKDARFEGDTDANLLFTDASTDRVGIGTATPATKLDVVGDVTVSGAVNAGSVNATTLDLTNLEVTNIKAKDGTASMTLADATGVASFSANPVLSGGTANGVLYLNGSKVATSGSALTFDGTNFTTTGYAEGNGLRSLGGNPVRFYNAANSNWSQISAPAGTGDMQFDTGAGEQMRLTSTGLGIGTSSPGARLEVNVPGTTGTSSALRLSRGIGYGTTDFKQYYTSGTDYGLTIGNTVSDYLTLNLASGNLGLGVTPSAWTIRGLQVASSSVANDSNDTYLTANGYFDGSWKYINSDFAAQYYQVNGVHAWRIAPSGTAGNAISFTQAMTLDGNGLGVGVASAQASASSKSTVEASGCLVVGGAINANQTSRGVFQFFNNETAIRSYGATSNSGQIVFSTGGGGTADTERARITSGGDLLVGTTSTTSGARLDVKGVDSTGSNYCMFFENSSNALLLAVQNDGRWRSGTAAASPYNYTVGATNRDLFVDNIGEIGYVSSVRASKTNIAPVSNVEWLLRLNPVTFNFRKKDAEGNYTEQADGPLKHGLIAEDVEVVNPDLCFYDDAEQGGTLRGVNYTHLITPMLKLIQEQQALITDLRARVAALESN